MPKMGQVLSHPVIAGVAAALAPFPNARRALAKAYRDGPGTQQAERDAASMRQRIDDPQTWQDRVLADSGLGDLVVSEAERDARRNRERAELLDPSSSPERH